MTTTEVLKSQLDNVWHEIQQLQVKDASRSATRGRTVSKNTIEELTLLNSEEKVIGAEQEAKQWNEKTVKLSTTLARVKKEYEKITKLFKDELVEKGSLVEQLKSVGSELHSKLKS